MVVSTTPHKSQGSFHTTPRPNHTTGIVPPRQAHQVLIPLNPDKWEIRRIEDPILWLRSAQSSRFMTQVYFSIGANQPIPSPAFHCRRGYSLFLLTSGLGFTLPFTTAIPKG